MKKISFFYTFILFVIGVCSFVSCSKDDDMGGGKGAVLMINGESYFADYDGMTYGMRFSNKGNYYSCDGVVYGKNYQSSPDSYSLYFHLSTDIKEGETIDDFRFRKFGRNNTLIETSSNNISGKVSLAKKSDSQITLKFSNYKFYVDGITSSLETSKGKEFVMDGELTMLAQ